ncbi:hypothetical protein HK405_000156, partial [Cladochytrium tenue]
VFYALAALASGLFGGTAALWSIFVRRRHDRLLGGGPSRTRSSQPPLLVPIEVSRVGGVVCSLFGAANAAALIGGSPVLVAVFYAVSSAGSYLGTAAFLYAVLQHVSPWDAGLRRLLSRVWLVLLVPVLQLAFLVYMGFRTARVFLAPDPPGSSEADRYVAEYYTGKLLFFMANVGYVVLIAFAQARFSAALRRGLAPYLLSARRALGEDPAAAQATGAEAAAAATGMERSASSAAVAFVPADGVAGSLGAKQSAAGGRGAEAATELGDTVPPRQASQSSEFNSSYGVYDDDDGVELRAAASPDQTESAGCGGGDRDGDAGKVDRLTARTRQLEYEVRTGTFQAMRQILRAFLATAVLIAALGIAVESVAFVRRAELRTAFATTAVSYWGI